MFKPRHAIAVLLGGIAFSAHADNPACQQKATEIEQQIEYAKSHGNTHRLQGLERALANVKAHCTDQALIRDKKDEIREQEEEIREILEEIREKQSEGRYDKLVKLERKLERERAEKDVLERELQALENAGPR
ncbi:DUF1090 domain-containing protein [Thauera butanivorans]|uniref:DUF1090 domain-containing protein n=1 Tax=Thauera butanivorans TaxID=86174 RepID=UPI000A06098A|nr:DUF1090 domain-containing protein [Thauera butanivorans]